MAQKIKRDAASWEGNWDSSWVTLKGNEQHVGGGLTGGLKRKVFRDTGGIILDQTGGFYLWFRGEFVCFLAKYKISASIWQFVVI